MFLCTLLTIDDLTLNCTHVRGVSRQATTKHPVVVHFENIDNHRANLLAAGNFGFT